VVVPARDASACIEACLLSLETQTLSRDRFEVIVVDNGSTDDTVAKAEAMGARCLSAQGITVYGARNAGVTVARGHVLAFTDSDCQVDDRWLETGLSSLRDCDIVAGRIAPPLSARGMLADYDRHIGRRHWGPDANCAAGNALVRRAVFDALGGFDALHGTAGDSLFSMRARAAGFRIRYCDDVVVYHPVDGWMRRVRGAFREGLGSSLKEPMLYGALRPHRKLLRRVGNLCGQMRAAARNGWSARQRGEVTILQLVAMLWAVGVLTTLDYVATGVARCAPRIARRLARD